MATAEIVLWGNGTPTREFLYVDDCVEGLALAAERYEDPAPVNLGTGEEIAIGDLAEFVRDTTGFEGAIRWDTSKPNGQPRRRLDTSRAEELFGLRAAVTLRGRASSRTVAWYRENAGSREHHGDGDPSQPGARVRCRRTVDAVARHVVVVTRRS